MQEQNNGLLPCNHSKEECWFPEFHQEGCREKQAQILLTWCNECKDEYKKQSNEFCRKILTVVPICVSGGWRCSGSMSSKVKGYMAGDMFAVCPNCHHIRVVWDGPRLGLLDYNKCEKCENKISYADFFQPICRVKDFIF